MGRQDEAVACFQRAVQVDPWNADAHNNLGAAWAATGQWSEATASYRRAIELQPAFAAAHYNLGLALQATDRAAEAIARANAELLTLHELIAHRLVQILLGLHRGRTFA